MILINVAFAETDHEYDFKADEQAPIEQVIAEMITMIAEKEHYALDKKPGLFFLCNPENAQILSPETTLTVNGIQSGMTLLLV